MIQKLLITTCCLLLAQPLFSQQSSTPSTADLSYLIGQWEVTRVYSPEDEKREYKGTLTCEEVMDGQFIQCIYDMERPGKIRGLDWVFFNYNSIYGNYEAVWLSSTWPIKNIMKGELEMRPGQFIYRTSGEFKIENEVTEYVKGDMTVDREGGISNSFIRHTYIRTSEYEPGVWRYHMLESARKVKR